MPNAECRIDNYFYSYLVAYFFDNIQVERSVRNFNENPVSESQVPEMAEAAFSADLPF